MAERNWQLVTSLPATDQEPESAPAEGTFDLAGIGPTALGLTFASPLSEWAEVYWTPAEMAVAGVTTQFVDPAGIATAEAFGAALIDQPLVTPAGIPSAEAFGSAKIDLTLNPLAIASAEAFGQATLQLTLNPSGIVTAEAFGVAKLDLTVNVTGIASAEAFGTAALVLHVNPAGIPSAEAFGAGISVDFAVTVLPSVGGITSAEAFGVATLVLHVNPAGIASGEAFGLATTGTVTEEGLALAPWEREATLPLRISEVESRAVRAASFESRSGIALAGTNYALVFEPEEL